MVDVNLSQLPQPLRIVSEKPPEKPRGGWAWLRDIGITGLAIGLITTVVTAYFQHSRWYVEQRLARSAADFAAASATFDAISSELARMQALQEILFFVYDEASRNPTPAKASFLAARGRETFAAYEKGRVDLRAKIDSFIFDARRHLDWPSSEKVPELVVRKGVDRDPLSYGKLTGSANESGFNCMSEKSMPQSTDNKTFLPSRFKEFQIDWNSSAHHLIVFSYCFRFLHNQIENARVWAGNLSLDGAPRPPAVQLNDKEYREIKKQLDNQVYRLNGFSAIAMTQVEYSRVVNAPPAFLAFMLQRRP